MAGVDATRRRGAAKRRGYREPGKVDTSYRRTQHEGTVRGSMRSCMAATLLAFNYVRAGSRRDRRSLCVGIITVALVVGFSTLLQSVIQSAPIIFLKLAEDQTGQADVLMLPDSQPSVVYGGGAGFMGSEAGTDGSSSASFTLLNSTMIEERLKDNELVAGAAPRWLALGKLANRDNPLRNTSCVIVVIDSAKEEAMGLGREWNLRPLGEQEVYVSSTALQELGLLPNRGERAALTLDLLDMLSTVGGGLSGGIDVDDPESVRSALVDAGFDLSAPVPVDVGGVGNTLADLFGIDGLDLGGLGTVDVDPSAAFDALYPALRSALVINQELIVLDGLDTPRGKWAPLLGNVVVIESKYAAQLVQEAAENVLTLLETLGVSALPSGLVPVTPAAGNAALPALTEARIFVDAFDEKVMAQYAMQVTVQAAEPWRSETYFQDSAGIKARLLVFTDSIGEDLGPAFPASSTVPLATALQNTQFIQLFLTQIFNGVAFLLGLLGVMVIYALVLGNVESKTYEYGMLRALGMRQRSLVAVLGIQSGFFAIPGVIIGLAVASLLNIVAMIAVGILAGITPPFGLHSSAWAVGISMGLIMPTIANVVPIRRALSSVLRDSLDLYHQTFSEVTVRMLKLAKLGLSPGQVSLALMLIACGLVTYYLLPLAFILNDLALFLGILNSILLGMLLGLTLVAQTLQPSAEAGTLWMLLWGRDKQLGTVIRKNLAGHRSRNRKTSCMVSIFVSFVIFAGTMFTLQTSSISTTVELLLGSDIVGFSPSVALPLPQEAMAAYLDTVKRPTASGPALVSDYTFITYPLPQVNPFNTTRFTNLVSVPRPRGTPFGLQSNYLDVAFDKFAVVSEEVPLPDTMPSSAGRNVIAALVNGRGTLVLPVEAVNSALNLQSPDGKFQPPLLINGEGRYTVFGCVSNSSADPTVVDGTVSVSPTYAGPWSCQLACASREYHECVEIALVNRTELRQSVVDSYEDYVDVVMSEAVREFSSVDTESAMRMQITARLPGFATTVTRTYLAKPRAMVAKLPGFFFSTYSQTSWGAPVIVPMQDAARLLLKADDDIRRVLSLDEAGGDGAPNDANEDDGDGPDADTTGEVRREDDGSVVSPNDNSLPPGGVWLLSSPAWTIVGDDRFVNGPVASDSNATLALDNRPSTHLEWSTEASTRPGSTPLWIAFDIGVCVAATGVRVYGSGTVGDVRMFKLSYSTNAITGPWTTALPSSQVGSDATGATRGWHEFAFPSSSTVSSAPAARFWRLDVEDNYGWQSGTVLVDVQLRGVAAQCTLAAPEADESATFVPKQRILVRLNPAANSVETRQRVLNGLRSTVTSDLMRIEDTAELLESADLTNLALQVFFNAVAALCLILAFFASWMSFGANIKENSREFGVLRALGLNYWQVVRVYIYEAMAVVLSSFTLGTIVGLLVSISLTLQFNLFIEMPFVLEFPLPLFLFTFVMSVVVAIVSSLLPARRLVMLEIAHVLQGKQ